MVGGAHIHVMAGLGPHLAPVVASANRQEIAGTRSAIGIEFRSTESRSFRRSVSDHPSDSNHDGAVICRHSWRETDETKIPFRRWQTQGAKGPGMCAMLTVA